MEQETKNKSKRALAIAGIATLSAFALIGLFAIGAIIGGCASSNKASADYVSSRAQPRMVAPPLSPSEFSTLDPSEDNLLLSAYGGHCFYQFIDGPAIKFTQAEDYDCFLLRDLPSGLYRLSVSNLSSWAGDYGFVADSVCGSIISVLNGISSSFSTDLDTRFSNFSAFRETVFLPISGNLDNLLLRCYRWSHVSLSLVDTLDVPASAVVTLPEDWNPTAWVSDEAIGGYPVVHGSYTTEANSSGAYVRVGWSNVVFKTASDSAAFTSLVVRYRWLWNGQKYRINDQTLSYSYSSEMALLYPVSVSYLDPLTNTWTIVAKEAQDVIGGEYVHTGKLNWLYPTYRTLGFLDYPENPTSPTIRFYHSGEAGSGEATWQPTPTLQGLSFFDWFGLASWNSPQQVDVGTGNAIGLISTAFSGMMPILGISIFPNITLGLLLFLPLIGGIIVLIIKAVSK